MDPLDPNSFSHRTERLSTGRIYHFIDEIPKGYNHGPTPTLLCVHGFPDLWYGWRYLIHPWVKHYGWRVIVPDMLGYGGTDKPADPKEYSTKALCDDLAALLDHVGVGKAVILGHDWGSATAWRFALWHSNRVRALVTMSIPFTPPRKEYISLEEIARRQPRFNYQLYFNDPSSTKEIEAKLPEFLSVLYSHALASDSFSVNSITTQASRPKSGQLLNDKEFDYYLKNFREGGMNGPLNYYRTTKHRYEEEVEKLPGSLPSSIPVLFLWGDKDRTCPPNQVERMNNYVPNLKVVMLAGMGHWVLLQAPETVVNEVGRFIRDVISNQSKL